MKKAIKSFANFLDRNVFPITIPLAIGMLFMVIFSLILKFIEHFGWNIESFITFLMYTICVFIGLPIYSWMIRKLFHQR